MSSPEQLNFDHMRTLGNNIIILQTGISFQLVQKEDELIFFITNYFLTG